ncbi:MAG: (2Fe-2S) ferredoxin domain-containing protein, partial [Lachnospiraceae bacterium]|nr:(2Fe-2S) ferredoxin domain-containing protein [Lachnospiraceae bacterium]
MKMFSYRIESREELALRRTEFKQALNAQKKQILICGGTGCVAGGSLKIYDRMQELLNERGIKCTVKLDIHEHNHEESVGLKKSGCHGFCEMGPLLRIEPM